MTTPLIPAGSNVASCRIESVASQGGNAITGGSRPLGIAVGGGAVWVANHGGDSITKIQP